jgi:hypothetical protein
MFMQTAHPSTIISPLPYAAPVARPLRLLLYVMRRMGTHGLMDAHAANALLGTFGQSYRRPLILLRALMLEMARTAQCRVTIAGCCCARMTEDEATLLQTITLANTDPRTANALLETLLATPNALAALTTAQALEQAFSDLGRPLN